MMKIAKPKNVVRWIDVPASKRIRPRDFMRCQGATDGRWLKRKLAQMRGGNCAAAIQPIPWKRGYYAKCHYYVVEGNEFCFKHGGAFGRTTRHPAKPKRELVVCGAKCMKVVHGELIVYSCKNRVRASVGKCAHHRNAR